MGRMVCLHRRSFKNESYSRMSHVWGETVFLTQCEKKNVWYGGTSNFKMCEMMCIFWPVLRSGMGGGGGSLDLLNKARIPSKGLEARISSKGLLGVRGSSKGFLVAKLEVVTNGNQWYDNVGITGPLWGESTSYRWIPLAKGQHY